jgi:hypothetical protein
VVHDPAKDQLHIGRLKAQLELETRRADDAQKLAYKLQQELEDLRATISSIKARYPHFFTGLNVMKL